MPVEKKDWTLTKESFDSLLEWLDKDRESAGEKYQEVRLKLIKIFACKGCSFPEDLADETINRVTQKLSEIKETYVGNPLLYFSSVSRLIYLENTRKTPNKVELSPNLEEIAKNIETSLEYECLEHCLEKLPSQSRELILDYYEEEKKAKIEGRKNIAERLGIELNALRLRVNRIRTGLEKCIQECINKKN